MNIPIILDCELLFRVKNASFEDCIITDKGAISRDTSDNTMVGGNPAKIS